MYFGTETKNTYSSDELLGHEMSRLGRGKFELKAKGKPLATNFSIKITTDKSAGWKMCQMGGGTGNAEHPCPLCACTSDELTDFKEGDDRCKRCIELHCPNALLANT